MKKLYTACLVVLSGAVAACGSQEPVGKSYALMEHITIDDGRVGANAANGKTAWIDSNGDLEIDGQRVALDPEARALALEYKANAYAIREQGVEIGKSGAKIAGTAISSVVDGLRRGDPDQIGPKVEAEAQAIEAQAYELCGKVGELQASQDALAAEVPAFLPYATITDETAADCRAKRATTG